jgi:hypothetical protein
MITSIRNSKRCFYDILIPLDEALAQKDSDNQTIMNITYSMDNFYLEKFHNLNKSEY